MCLVFKDRGFWRTSSNFATEQDHIFYRAAQFCLIMQDIWTRIEPILPDTRDNYSDYTMRTYKFIREWWYFVISR